MAHYSTDTVYGIGYNQGEELDNRDLGTTEVRVAAHPDVVFDINPMFALEIVENAIENDMHVTDGDQEFRSAIRTLRYYLDTEDK